MSFNERLTKFLIRERKIIFYALCSFSIGLCFFIPDIKVDNRLEVWFLEDDPSLQNYKEFQSQYGNEEFIALYFPAPNADLADPQYVKKIFESSQKIEEHPYVRRVYSITHIPYLTTRDDELIVEKVVNSKTYEEDSAQLLNRLRNDPKLMGLVVSAERDGSVLIVEPENTDNFDEHRKELLDHIQSVVGLNVPTAGMGVLYQELNEISARDAAVFTLVSYVLLFTFLFIFFRSLRVLLAASCSVILSLLLLFGFFGLFKQSFNMVNMILPNLLLVTCLLNLVHLFRQWNYSRDFEKSLAYCLPPCFLTSATTSAGLLALCVSPMQVLRSFGAFAALAVMVEFIIVIAVFTFFFAKSSNPPNPLLLTKAESLVDKLSQWTITRPKKIILASIVLLSFVPWGLSKLEVNTYSMGFLLEDNPIRKASDKIEEEYGDYLALEVFLRTSNPEGVKDPRFLETLSRLQLELEALPEVSYSLSVSDLIKQIHLALTEEERSIPSTREAVAQELLLYEMDSENQISSFVRPDYQEARMSLRIPMMSSQEMKSIIEKVDRIFEKGLPPDITHRFGGYVPLYVQMMNYITESQLKSFAWACSLIFLLMSLIFRSPRIFIIGIIVNIIPIGVTLALMGFAGIYLDIATVTIAAIALGIVVDDTTHFIFKYQSSRKTLPAGLSVQEAFRSSGVSNIITSLLLIAGFSVMMLAEIKSVIFFGLLICVCIAVAALCDLLLLPALLFQTDKKIEAVKQERIRHVR